MTCLTLHVRSYREKSNNMDKKQIGIRYCGGCNPKFDRTAYAAKLQSVHPDWEFVYMDAIKNTDTVIIVSGCERICTKTDDLNGKTLIYINNENAESYLNNQ